MFKDTDNHALVTSRLRGLDHTAVAGIFSPDREEQAAKLGYQEFGTPTIQQRQTVAPAFDQGEAAMLEQMRAGVDDVIEGRSTGRAEAERTADYLEANIRERIESNTPPVLADSTLAARRRRIRVDREGVAAKGGRFSTQTLVDAGDMLASVEHGVDVEVPGDG